jgi:proline iminopeptidase
MNGLHPEPPLLRRFMLPVDPPHELHVETAGAPDGVPVVFLHGGPGGPWSAAERCFFDPERFLLVSFDQRGAHRSRPLGELAGNTLDDLAGDIEAIRRALGIERWIMFGGSFGSALALHYAERFPRCCRAVVLWGILTGRPGFETWDFEGSRFLHPESWQAMADAMPGEAGRPLSERCFDAILAGGAPSVSAARAWYRHSATLGRVSDAARAWAAASEVEGTEAAAARLSAHYWRNRLFVPPGALTERARELDGIPGFIVHGRRDHNTLIGDAFDLHRAWPGSRYAAVEDAGHSAFEPGIARELIALAAGLA